jgi:hypothetical protein
MHEEVWQKSDQSCPVKEFNGRIVNVFNEEILPGSLLLLGTSARKRLSQVASVLEGSLQGDQWPPSRSEVVVLTSGIL